MVKNNLKILKGKELYLYTLYFLPLLKFIIVT